MIQLHPVSSTKLKDWNDLNTYNGTKYISTNYIESLQEIKNEDKWLIRMASGDTIIISTEELIKFDLLQVKN